MQMKLFTMVLQDDQRTVLPVAFCLVSSEDRLTIKDWLQAIAYRMHMDWRPSCMLTDASQAQIGAAR